MYIKGLVPELPRDPKINSLKRRGVINNRK